MSEEELKKIIIDLVENMTDQKALKLIYEIIIAL